MWGWLKPSIDSGVKKGIDNYLEGPRFKSLLINIIDQELKKPKYAWFWFVKHMQARMMQVDKTLDGKRAWELALNAYREHLKDEKIQYGDDRYDWSKDGAYELIQAYEIDHWESR